ncbi:chromate transporter [Paenibacillus glycanilyticus]|uniref:Chromate transporter n=1 Tax=Paenibacillus glycanilyticus TaxID=126569 RepID=A0ABQ6GL34_9BACL|nr:chromate transporter [Paenibacillus glycanilyticus]GLX70341.1 chromate transporter [Paenibacillus glycanilyticus]
MNTNWKKPLYIWVQLFWVFARIGPSTFGGGYAMMPAIEREVVDKRKWMSQKELADVVSIAGSAPGGVGVNAAAFIGYKKARIPGAAMAVIGVTSPTFIIVIAFSLIYLIFQDSPKLEAALKGIHGAVVALIIMAAYRMAKAAIFDTTTAVLAICALFALLALPVTPLYIVAAGILTGICFIRIKEIAGKKTMTEKPSKSRSGAEPIYPEYYI